MPPIRLMKPVSIACDDATLSKLRYPLLASPKLDGIRAATPNGLPQSNSGKPFPNRALMDLLSQPAFANLDGELIVGDPCAHGVLHRTQSVVMSEDAPLDNLCFYAFDSLQDGGPFALRTPRYRHNMPHELEFLPQSELDSPQAVIQYVEQTLGLGYEGVILRDPAGRYKNGRSTLREGGMLRIKPREDTEATIVGYDFLEINDNAPEVSELGFTKRSSAKSGKIQTNLVGSVRMRDPRWPKEFGATVADHAMRAYLAELGDGMLGKIGKFSYMPYGSMEAPRQTSFIGLRSPIDLDSPAPNLTLNFED